MATIYDFFILILVVLTTVTFLWGRINGAAAVVLGLIGGVILYFIVMIIIMKIGDFIQKFNRRR